MSNTESFNKTLTRFGYTREQFENDLEQLLVWEQSGKVDLSWLQEMIYEEEKQ